LYAPPVQALWLLIPALMLGLAALRMHGESAHGGSAPAPASARLPIAALAAGIACIAFIAAGIAIALHADHTVEQLGGTPWPFAIAFACAAALAVIGVIAARRRAWMVVVGSGLWLSLALFWLV
jgi:branched-subunit amino acid transport protein